jgi:hypothetical protein
MNPSLIEIILGVFVLVLGLAPGIRFQFSSLGTEDINLVAVLDKLPICLSLLRAAGSIPWVRRKWGNRRIECSGCGRKLRGSYDVSGRRCAALPRVRFR